MPVKVKKRAAAPRKTPLAAKSVSKKGLEGPLKGGLCTSQNCAKVREQ
jgi:hypothetical protein